jgi:biotin transport system substrate-specific component
MSTGTKLTLSSSLGHSEQSVLSQALWIAAFAAATAFGARLEIPNDPVPYTLQTLVVLLAGALLGLRNGTLSQLLYLSAGVLGVPVFAGGAFGIAQLLGPTGGYLVSFPIAAAVVGYLVPQRRGLLWIMGSMTAGLFVVFFCGTLHLYAFALHDWGLAVQSGFLIFSWWDIVKLVAAATTYHEISKRWPKVPV